MQFEIRSRVVIYTPDMKLHGSFENGKIYYWATNIFDIFSTPRDEV